MKYSQQAFLTVFQILSGESSSYNSIVGLGGLKSLERYWLIAAFSVFTKILCSLSPTDGFAYAVYS